MLSSLTHGEANQGADTGCTAGVHAGAWSEGRQAGRPCSRPQFDCRAAERERAEGGPSTVGQASLLTVGERRRITGLFGRGGPWLELRNIRRVARRHPAQATRRARLLTRQPPQQLLALEPHDAPEAGRRHGGVLLSPTEHGLLVDPQHVGDLAGGEEGRQGISGHAFGPTRCGESSNRRRPASPLVIGGRESERYATSIRPTSPNSKPA